MIKLGRSFHAIGAILVLPLTFALDLATPLGVSIWALYLVPLLLTYRLCSPRWVAGIALLGIALLVAGYFASPRGIGTDFALLNRVLGAGLIGTIAIILIRQAHLTRRIAGDMAAQQEHERELTRSNRFYATVNKVSQAVSRSKSKTALFEQVCRVLVESGGFDLAWIGWYDPEAERIAPAAIWGGDMASLEPIPIKSEDRSAEAGPVARAFLTRKPYFRDDLNAGAPGTSRGIAPAPGEFQAPGEYQAVAALPLQVEGQTRGVLTVYSKERGFIATREATLLAETAADVSLALDRSAALEARDLAERQLRNEKEFSDTMIESMPGILYFYDSQGRFLRWNRNFESVSGYSREDIRRMHPLDYFSEEDRPRVARAIAQVFEKGSDSIEAAFLTRGGVGIPYYFTGQRVLYEGEPCLVGVGIDISARHQAEVRLARSERQYRELVEYANSIILRWNADGRISFLNEFGQRFFGYSASEIVGRRITETILPPEDGHGLDLARLIERINAAPEDYTHNINENLRRTGERAWISWTNRIVRDDQGRIVEFLSVGTDITEQRQAEDARHAAEVRFQTLFEQAPIGVVLIDPASAAIVECNGRAARQLGYAPEELCRRTLPEIEASLSAPEVHARIASLRTDSRREFETRHRASSGEIRDVFVSAQLLEIAGRPFVHAVFVDITERKLAEKRTRESEARYRTLFEYAPDGILLCDPEGFYFDGNPSICRMLGYAREEMIGLHSRSIVAPQDLAMIEPALRELAQRLDHHREWRFRRKDGSEFSADVIATQMPDGNTLAMIRDVSERKEAEAERFKRHQAEAADRIKSAFLATMSHELRTPLNSIIGFTGIILQGLAGPLNPEQQKQLDMVRSSARHLLALVNDVLDISKIEAGQLETAREPFDVVQSITKVVRLIAPLAHKKGLELQVQAPDTIEPLIGDERRFEQILLNLLGNAVKFTDRGHVRLQADIERRQGDGFLVLRISDTGMGIRHADLAHLFQPFRQIDSGLSRNHDGTGLGLAICRRLAELMGGTIQVESTWGVGSTFSVTLPMKDVVR